MGNSSQTVYFCVNACKISHVDLRVNDVVSMPCKRSAKQMDPAKMKLNPGKVLECLEMTLDCSWDSQVKITMLSCIKEMSELFKKTAPDIWGTKSSATQKKCLSSAQHQEQQAE